MTAERNCGRGADKRKTTVTEDMVRFLGEWSTWRGWKKKKGQKGEKGGGVGCDVGSG